MDNNPIKPQPKIIVEVKQEDESFGNSPQEGLLIQNIVFRPINRESQTVQKWRNAMQYAESMSGIRVPLYNLYEDLVLDPVLWDLMDKRIMGVTKNRLIYQDADGNENEEVKEIIKLQQFRLLRKELARRKFWGISACELMIENDKFSYYNIPRRNLKPRIKKIVWEQYGSEGVLYDQPPYSNFIAAVCDDSEDLGLLLKAAPLVLWKRGNMGDWAQYTQIFGMPFRKATWDGFNENTRLQLEAAMEQAGSAGYAVLPEGANMEFLEPKNTQGSTVYDDLRKACNQELSILILGQTETTSKTAGKMGGNDDTHEKTEDEINADDREEELAVMNEIVKPILINLGLIKDKSGSFVHQESEVDITPEDAVDMAIKMRESGTPVSDDDMYAISKIPKPKNYDALKAEIKEAAMLAEPLPDVEDTQDGPPAPGKKKPVPKKKPAGQLNAYDKFLQGLSDFFDRARKS